MTNNTNLSIGKKIQDIRKTKGITQERLAELSNLSVNYISRIERTNTQNISIQSLYSIANSLEVDLYTLLLDDTSHIKSGFNTTKLINFLNEIDKAKADKLSKHFLNLIEDFKEL
ncbi:hypothetical protein RD055328_09600 [Companilactobacillus sp. RD055328]|uniref:helix-turn-helix domain-containing protein n=1 Tax=Companilactobacillus sp. RD055328 TaxID=2916634 RepID=UPI001FC87028|nr:helix-turn-helix transcriptional regulator [Companilactobacillus sp. RD055328]GKQ43037.1 hypothetical protein RD055328_09600 [Companilactobacillus sp. RD055328]